MTEIPGWLLVVAGGVGLKLFDFACSIAANVVTPGAVKSFQSGAHKIAQYRAFNIAMKINQLEVWAARPTAHLCHALAYLMIVPLGFLVAPLISLPGWVPTFHGGTAKGVATVIYCMIVCAPAAGALAEGMKAWSWVEQARDLARRGERYPGWEETLANARSNRDAEIPSFNL